MTTATLSQVHTSPLKPCASAPLANSSGNLARCSSLRRDGAPGGGLCLKASAPSSLARFIHRLTAPSLFPRASAISDCFQPRSFNSKARKRLPSRQLVAWLDSVFSIVGFVIPMSLDLYAEICSPTVDLNPQLSDPEVIATSARRRTQDLPHTRLSPWDLSSNVSAEQPGHHDQIGWSC